jgi:hypothetical protein
MPVAWYVVPYTLHPVLPRTRYPAIDDYTAQIKAAGGTWSETEILGNQCLVKVRGPVALLQALAGVYTRLPKDQLDDSLADLSSAVRSALRDWLQDSGYSLAEIRARFGDDLGSYTLRDVLRFAASRRLKPRWDEGTGEIVLDGEAQACRPVDNVDAEVVE